MFQVSPNFDVESNNCYEDHKLHSVSIDNIIYLNVYTNRNNKPSYAEYDVFW